MSVLASAMITLAYVTSVESETRYYKTQVSTLSPPSKPTSVPPGNGWIETEPTYSDSSATSVLYTCVLTQFTDGTFAYSEVSVSSSYEASKSAYNQAHEANQKLASWCSKTDTTLFDGAKIATGSVITEALDAGCVTTDKLAVGAVKAKNIDTENLFAQDIKVTGTLRSKNYNGIASNPLANTAGSIFKMDNGNMNLGGGKLLLKTDKETNITELIIDGKISGKDILVKGEDRVTNGDYTVHVMNKIETSFNNTGDPETSSAIMTISQTYDDGDEAPEAALIFKNGRLTLSGTVDASVGCYSETWNYDEFASTSGLSGTFTDGQLTVTKKMGICWISGTITLGKSISAWKTILNSTIVPRPQHRTLVPFEMCQWTASYKQPLRGKILANGGLQLVYGAAGNYVVSISYPID